jgi:hypothetical protein
VVLALVDRVTGVVWPPVTAPDEGAAAWEGLFQQAQVAGLDVGQVRGMASDGAAGLEAYRRAHLPWVSHQRCVFHLWRGLAGLFTQAMAAATAVSGLTGAAAVAVRTQTRRALVPLVRAVYDAPLLGGSAGGAGHAGAHAQGGPGQAVQAHLDDALVQLCGYNQGLGRASPEWLWRDFRLRLSHGRNHASDARLEQAGLVWAIYHNFAPLRKVQRKRHYRHPGQCPLAAAGVPPGVVSYLDALGV